MTILDSITAEVSQVPYDVMNEAKNPVSIKM